MPYGYGEKLIFTLESENPSTEIYTAEYPVDLSKNFQLTEDLTAVVSQTYYYDVQNKMLTKIETDLSDLHEKTYIANDITNNGGHRNRQGKH